MGCLWGIEKKGLAHGTGTEPKTESRWRSGPRDRFRASPSPEPQVGLADKVGQQQLLILATHPPAGRPGAAAREQGDRGRGAQIPQQRRWWRVRRGAAPGCNKPAGGRGGREPQATSAGGAGRGRGRGRAKGRARAACALARPVRLHFLWRAQTQQKLVTNLPPRFCVPPRVSPRQD